MKEFPRTDDVNGSLKYESYLKYVGTAILRNGSLWLEYTEAVRGK